MPDQSATCRCGKHHVCANHLTLASYTKPSWWKRLLGRLGL